MPNLEAIASCRKELGAYLKASVPTLKKVIDGWPYGNTPLAMPCVSVFSQKNQYRNLPPTQIAVTVPDRNGNVVQTLRVGENDFRIQLDLWARNDVERDAFGQLLKDALSPKAISDPSTSGLSLQLGSYFNEWVRFDLDDDELVEGEQASQRGEWRRRFSLLVNCGEIKQRTGKAMTTIQTYVGVTTNPAAMTDSAQNADTVTTV